MQVTYQQLLQRELDQRSRRNSAYSLRAFAQFIGLTAPHLSAVLNGKKGISVAMAKKIAETLGWDPQESLLFQALVKSQHSRKRSDRFEAEKEIADLIRQRDFQTIDLDQFSLISDWHHFAILHLFELADFQSDANWISEKLSLDLSEIEQALARLEKLEMIDRSGSTWALKKKAVSTPNVPSSAIRNNHHQVLQLAANALEKQAIDDRDFSSVFMPIDRALLPELKETLKKFRRKFSQDAGLHRKNALYCLSIQFFDIAPSTEKK